MHQICTKHAQNVPNLYKSCIKHAKFVQNVLKAYQICAIYIKFVLNECKMYKIRTKHWESGPDLRKIHQICSKGAENVFKALHIYTKHS